jgi:hypothetical protein
MESGPAKRTQLSKTIEIGHESVASALARLRSFRNIVLLVTLLVWVLVAVIVLVGFYLPDSVALCFTSPRQAALVACPTGDGPGRLPSRADAFVIALLGVIGGTLSSVVAIRNLRGSSTPYNLPVALALLKIPTGAVTSLGGLIMIRGQFIPGLTVLESQPQILAYALVFGYAQQLFTGLVDKRSLSLLDNLPDGNPEGRHPEPVIRVNPSSSDVAASIQNLSAAISGPQLVAYHGYISWRYMRLAADGAGGSYLLQLIFSGSPRDGDGSTVLSIDGRVKTTAPFDLSVDIDNGTLSLVQTSLDVPTDGGPAQATLELHEVSDGKPEVWVEVSQYGRSLQTIRAISKVPERIHE